MKKYTYYRHFNGGFGFKNSENSYTFVHNNENDEWFAVYRGQSVKKRDNSNNYHFERGNFHKYVKDKVWIPYSRRPRQVLP